MLRELGRGFGEAMTRHARIAPPFGLLDVGGWERAVHVGSVAAEAALHEMDAAAAKALPKRRSAEGGRKAALTKKAEAEARHAEARRMIAKKLEKLAQNGQTLSTRALALQVQSKLKTPLSLSTIRRLIGGQK